MAKIKYNSYAVLFYVSFHEMKKRVQEERYLKKCADSLKDAISFNEKIRESKINPSSQQ